MVPATGGDGCVRHRNGGLGDVPGIAGRHPNYIVRQMWNMQNGERIGTSAALMRQVVENLSNDDMLAIAAYVASRKP